MKMSGIEIQYEKTVLIGLITEKQNQEQVTEYLDELGFLAETAGYFPVKNFIQRLAQANSKTYVGSGKIIEIKRYLLENEIYLVIFDEELSPTQIRNIEKSLNEGNYNQSPIKILDRTSLILDIFAMRARTAYSKTQVQLAQYQYLLPRLTRMWTHLERQRGGINMRGPGETQIETDRRIILNKISDLKEDLINIDKQMLQQRKNRDKLIRVALVGYTNVGKSTIMNILSKSDVFAENKLFATLDTTVRKTTINNLAFLLSDTVGFIRKLPHNLIESFKSTLEEAKEADLIIHVVDISHKNFFDQIKVVDETLKEIGANDKKTLVVFNKVDSFSYVKKEADDLLPRTKENLNLEELQSTYFAKKQYPSIFISAKTKQNINEFRTMLFDIIKELNSQKFFYSEN
ncbi:MAG: GTPase HflX [Bacteroidales bacterium]|nr:GTPase HflX [Bacteroidales bacterium]